VTPPDDDDSSSEDDEPDEVSAQGKPFNFQVNDKTPFEIDLAKVRVYRASLKSARQT